MKVVILCGGRGLRMGIHSEQIPKPMAKIGNKPILWHIMEIYSYYGFNEFILCLGYKGEKIKDYFKNSRDWDIIFADTDLNTNTGGRIKRIEKYIKDDVFFATYGDGLSDINLTSLLKYHRLKGKTATVTVVKPLSPFGMVQIDSDNLITEFREKPILDYWINGGFFVFNSDIFEYIERNDTLEKEVFERLVKDKQLCAYKHKGFWRCMDSYKDKLDLDEMLKKGETGWVIWGK